MTLESQFTIVEHLQDWPLDTYKEKFVHDVGTVFKKTEKG